MQRMIEWLGSVFLSNILTKTKIMRGSLSYREWKEMYPRRREQHMQRLQGQMTFANLMNCKSHNVADD